MRRPAPGRIVAAASAALLSASTARAGDFGADGRTSAQRVAGFEQAIGKSDRSGPSLHAIIALNPRAGADARALDAERAAGHLRGPLHGVPILIKDNIETADGMATTAGSLALKDNVTGRDAPLVARLRDAGAVILGKTNLSEWANFRSAFASSGWSAVGGQTRNPHDPSRSPCGSSSGSAVAVAAGFAAAAIGTETDGSITCPAAVNGVVGLKPTVGLVSRSRIIPISHSQDTAGPITATVRDAALLLAVIAGADPADPATREADAHRTDYAGALDAGSLKGTRIGVMRFAAGFHPQTDAVFETALARLRAAGAVLVQIADGPDRKAIGEAEQIVLATEFKADIDAWLATTSPDRVRTRTLADLIAFDRGHAAEEMPLFGQDVFEAAEATKGLADPAYLTALATGRRLAGAEGIDRMLAVNQVVALVAPTLAPAWVIDPVLGDHDLGGGAGSLAAVAGYPHLTVPMGTVSGLPVGLSFIGPAWSEARLLSLGYAFEQSTPARGRSPHS
ncbi:MAG TPA: amidase [Caulobacteraceae bacterium]|nr:amidase [Caulobacteraceae bacterium]